MAEGFLRHLGVDRYEVFSAGTEPGEKVAPKAIEVMAEKGIDISGQYPKLLNAEMVEKADICISMGCGVEESCPVNLFKAFTDWNLEDPWGQGIERYRETRDLIEENIRKFLEEENE